MADKERGLMVCSFEDSENTGSFKMEATHPLFSNLSEDDKSSVTDATSEFIKTLGLALRMREELKVKGQSFGSVCFNLAVNLELFRGRLDNIHTSVQAETLSAEFMTRRDGLNVTEILQ